MNSMVDLCTSQTVNVITRGYPHFSHKKKGISPGFLGQTTYKLGFSMVQPSAPFRTPPDPSCRSHLPIACIVSDWPGSCRTQLPEVTGKTSGKTAFKLQGFIVLMDDLIVFNMDDSVLQCLIVITTM